ncbi:YhgE/Pip family protein [Clostridium sp.]|uniref:YhgE/Pip family protein n=1 Tax=Clostridium sp. TaxID=1506 RepID=UPI003463D5EF
MNFLKIAKQDISSTFKNRFIRISVIAIIIVPLLYSLLYLAAFWDPYNKLNDLPVAVVNMDKGAIKDDEDFNAGKDVVDKLKENSVIGWKFVSYEEAQKGVEGDKYYAAFVIPENFSEEVMSAKDGAPKEPKIFYTANEKRNFLAAQINGKVLVELKGEISKNITKQYTEVAFDKMYELKDGMEKAADGSKELSEGLDTLNSKVPELSDGVEKLYDGSGQLKDGLGELNSKIPTLSGGVNQLQDGSKTLSTSLDQYRNSAINPVATGIKDLNNGLKGSVLPGAKKLEEGSYNLAKGLGQAIQSSKPLSDGAESLSNNLSKLQDGASKLKDGEKSLEAGIGSLKEGSNQVANGVDALIDESTKAQGKLQSSVENNLKKYLASNPEAMKDPNMQMFLKDLEEIKQESKASLPQVASLKKGAHDLNNGISSFGQGIEGFIKGSEEFSKGATLYSEGAKSFSLGANSLTGGIKVLHKGAEDLNSGLRGLNSGLNDKFSKGLEKIDGSMPMVVDSTNKLYDGAKKLDGGLSELSGNVPVLAEGVIKLYDGSNALNTGLGELNSNIPELSDGVTKLYDGSKELSDKLGDGSQQLKDNLKNDSETMGKFVSEPVKMDETKFDAVPDYGTGFAPYFIPLSLWIGALMMFFIITDKVEGGEDATPGSLVLGKFLSYGYIGIIQAVLTSVVVLFLGLKPANLPLYILFNVFLSFVFISIIQCFIYLLGEAGRLLSIVLLVLQLTACAGTFPLEVVPDFFKALNPFMPFTYAVSGLRELISGVDYSVLTKDFVVLGSTMVVFLVISVIMKGHADKLQERVRNKKEEVAI